MSRNDGVGGNGWRMIWLNEMNAWLEGNDGMGGNGWRMIWLNEMNVWLEGNDGMGGNGWRMMGRGAMVTIIGPSMVLFCRIVVWRLLKE